jgi:hypothetical protein
VPGSNAEIAMIAAIARREIMDIVAPPCLTRQKPLCISVS